MKTAVSHQDLHQKYLFTLLLSLVLAVMGLALLLLIVFIAVPKKTAVSPTPMPTAETFQTTTDPLQTAVTQNKTPIIWQRENYNWKLTARADFQIVGRVLSRQLYNNDWQSEISPIDLAIGWGELSDPKADKWLKWRQSGRWYYYFWQDDSPFDEQYLRTHSSNLHIVPASENLEAALLQIRKNDKILMEGRLVDLEATNPARQWQNKTSLSRTDSGNGACEIFLVERLVWNGQEYH